ncbi:hybrid sensor histidine kinase/response regulator transcription factor [uncultured Psychroserpens sp.]|uniref:hybrid sensor histidine kinase/response regulator transcription factor n=1 Tax=uncultured Psychroserpens sp. TaxID=255436 RepID=UPI002620038B|nr:hybrid sensor histidine kinase/response regulator transcription factor [uncultured Psychroserpens sp.]
MNRILYVVLLFLVGLSCFSQDSKQKSFRELTVAQGLSQNSVVSIAQDSTGYMWFATQDGLNKYDGRQFTFFNKQFEDVTRPTYSKLGKIYVDRDSNLWIISNSGILEKFNTKSQEFKTINGITNTSVIFQNTKDDYYIGTFGNGLHKIDAKSKDTVSVFKNEINSLNTYDIIELNSDNYIATSSNVFLIKENTIEKINVEGNLTNFSALSVCKNNTVWLGSFSHGLFYKPIDSEGFKQFKHPNLPPTLNIQDLLIDNNNNLWIATYGDGLYILNQKTNQIEHFTENKDNAYALHYNDVLCLYQDYTGTVWLGTDGAGLSYYDEHLTKFNVITNSQTPKNVVVDVIRAITYDANKTMWLGTSGKGLTSINLDQNIYKTYTTQNSNLASGRIMSLLSDGNNLWIGHQGEGLQYLDSSGKFETISALKGETIWKILKHNSNQFWMCTRDSGIILFDKDKGVLEQFTSDNSGLTSNNIRTLEKGTDNIIWIGSENNGLFIFDTKSKTINPITSIPDKIKSLYYDNRYLYVGTNGNGLIRYHPINKSIKSYTMEFGLSNNVIYAILPDEKGNLWLSSNKGITRFNPLDKQKFYVENYTEHSGLQSFEFNTGAYFKSNDGTLFFGGLEGINWFSPSSLSTNTVQPKTVISKFEIFNEEQEMVPMTTFRHDQNTITFTFASLHFSEPSRNWFRYKLLNHDDNWSKPDYNNAAHYTNLPADKYTFLVTSSNYEGIWNKEPARYSFVILKPWYKTNLAYTIYGLLLALVIFAIFSYFKFKWKLETQVRLEHAETERLKQIDEFKTKLYTNISHEFRTPLTLISGPIDHQLSRETLEPSDREELNLVKQNANRLLNLVNQMLDLSLIDSGQLRLQVEEGNLNILLKQIVAAFQYKANEKHIKIDSNIENLKNVWYDTDLIEKIASNLLSNAIKYAPEQSTIIIDANALENNLVLSVININKTISKKDFEKLFQRFYQDDEASDGVGVGLALVKELVNLSKGSITANTVDQNKVQFTVTLPIHKNAFEVSEMKNESKIITTLETLDLEVNKNADAPLLLVVEDDKDIRTFVSSIFNNTYNIIEAENGQVGIDMAIQYIPDVIISDVMMPIQDGIELCNHLKYNELTSHIPIILLTAKVGDDNEIEGLKTGADAYVTKPFNSDKLKLRVKKLIENRQQLQKHFSKDFTINPELSITSTEAEFLKRLKTVLDEKITNVDFTSEAFSEAMFMSRTQLHRKLKAIVNMSASEFIRAQRLKLAIGLLKKSDATVSEIAYQVGFNTPSYFIKCFKDAYNCTPSEYISKI